MLDQVLKIIPTQSPLSAYPHPLLTYNLPHFLYSIGDDERDV